MPATGQTSQWVNVATNESSDRAPTKPVLAKYRLRSNMPGSDGRCRWCEDHAIKYVNDHDDSKQLDDVLEDPKKVPLPAALKCLEGHRICGTIWHWSDVIPSVIAVAVAIPMLGCIGWIVGTLLSDDKGVMGHQFSFLAAVSTEVIVAVKGTAIVIAVPLIWAALWVALVRPPGDYNEQYSLRRGVRKIPCGIGDSLQGIFEQTSLSNQVDANFSPRGSTDSTEQRQESVYAPKQLLNRYLLQPLASNGQKEQWARAVSIWHVFLWAVYISLIGTAIEPLSCQENAYGSLFMSAHGAESIECNWCTGDRDLKNAFPRINEDFFTGPNFFGLFGLFGLFDIVPLRGYGLFASMSMFCTVFYFFGIPIYFIQKLHEHRDRVKDRNFEYAFLTDKMKEDLIWWEVAILVRKGLLAIFSTLSAGSPVAMGLFNLIVISAATLFQFYLRPYAHSDINRVEDWSLISTVLVLLVGLGGLAEDGASAQPDGQSTDASWLDNFNDLAMFVLGIHFLHTFTVILNRLSLSVWLIREEKGCGCKWPGAFIIGALLGALVGATALVFVVMVKIGSIFDYSTWTLQGCDDYSSCKTESYLSTGWLIGIVISSAALFGLFSAYLAWNRWCRCCNRRGRSLCCYGCNAGCGLCGKCTFPCFYPCFCARDGCCHNSMCLRPIAQRLDLPVYDCCGASPEESREEDAGDYWLDALDTARQLEEVKFDEVSMDDLVRKALHKSKLDLADVWANYGVHQREGEQNWEDAEYTTAELLKEAHRRAVGVKEQARLRKSKAEERCRIDAASADSERERESAQEWLKNETRTAEKQHETGLTAIREVQNLKRKQQSRERMFQRKAEQLLREADESADERKGTRARTREVAMESALKERFRNEALNLLRKQSQQRLQRVVKDLDKWYEDTKDVSSHVTETLKFFPDEQHWQRTVLLYLTDPEEWRKRDQELLVETVTKGMTKTDKKMRNELMPNRLLTQFESWLLTKLSSDRRGSVCVSRSAVDDADDDEFQARESVSMDSIRRGSQAGGLLARPGRSSIDSPDAVGDSSGTKACRAKARQCLSSVCTGPVIVFGFVAVIAGLTLLFVVFSNLGCCKPLVSDSEHNYGPEDWDGWAEVKEKSMTVAKWQKQYHLKPDSCANVNLERGQNCTMKCEEGYIYSQGDINVERSMVFTCAGRYVDRKFKSEDGWWDRMFTPKWHFVNWTKMGAWATIDAVPNDTTSGRRTSLFIKDIIYDRKEQEHPHCWKDPCYHKDHLSDPTTTACGNFTLCDRRCDDGSADGKEPKVPSPGKSGQSLCGVVADMEHVPPIKDSLKFDYTYPSKAVCSCLGDHVPIDDAVVVGSPGCKARAT